MNNFTPSMREKFSKFLNDRYADITPEYLQEVSKIYNVKYLSEATQELDEIKGIIYGHTKYLSEPIQELDEVDGILYGRTNRFIGLMKATISGKTKNVFFLVDTGSPRTYISADLLNAYNITVSNETHYNVLLNKRHITAGISPEKSCFSYLNLLGTDYMSLYGAELNTDFEEKKFTIKFKPGYSE